MRALWNGVIIAESDDIVELEGNHYFPAESVKLEFIQPGEPRTNCPWKGRASYFSIVVGDDTNVDAAWYYPEPKDAAQHIKGRVAFWKGVIIIE